jgi:hypothetical protein
MNLSQALDFSAYLGRRNDGMPWRNPAQAYADFLTAVARRDADSVIARMTDNYARRLNECRARRDFERDFSMWCEKYPRDLKVTGHRIDGDTATLETLGHGAGGMLAGRVTMVLNGGMWCVGAERWADDCEHLRIARLSPCLT